MAEGLTRLLLVAHYFPPDGGAGTQRPASFCRFLPALGFEVEVVTRAVADTERGHWEPRDDSVDANDRHVRINRAEREAGESWTDALAPRPVGARRLDGPSALAGVSEGAGADAPRAGAC